MSPMMMKGSGSSDRRDSISSELMFWLGGKHTEQRVMILERDSDGNRMEFGFNWNLSLGDTIVC